MSTNGKAPAQRLIVVSNRLPLTLRRTDEGWRTEHSPGGLATALGPMLRGTEGLWIGWPGETTQDDEGREAELRRWLAEERCLAVDLTADVAARFYEGYANQTLWPLFHHFPLDLHYEEAEWDAYVEANRAFRDKVLSALQPGDRVWIHDYQLMLLPEMLREAAADLQIGFFLHIPFPSSEVFRILPRREEILRGLLGADLVAFQTHNDLQHFRSCLARILGFDSRMDRVELAGRFIRLEALPIGIADEEFAGLLQTGREAQKALSSVRRRFAGKRVLRAEKSDLVGGTTAMSGGCVWVPANHHMKAAGQTDSREEALAYLHAVAPPGWAEREAPLWESFVDAAHLARIQSDAEAIVSRVLAAARA